MGEIRTYSGIMFDPLNPDPEKITIQDIAHALSMLCRANGHFKSFYSVGQHCINCLREAAARGYSRKVQLGCLLHDGSEAYLSDITRPVKAALPAYLQIEAPLQNVIWEKWLGSPLTEEEYNEVFSIDDAMLEHEFFALADTKFHETLPKLQSSPVFDFCGFTEVEQEYSALFHASLQDSEAEVTVAQMKQMEKDADAAGLSYTQMMENAGKAASDVLLEVHSLQTAAVFCGTGNNGGDGFVVARHLAEAGKSVHIFLVGGMPKTQDAALNFQKAKALGIPVFSLDALPDEEADWCKKADAVVDGIYGTGFHGHLRPAGIAACSLIHASTGFCLALDLPSGLNADTGLAAHGAVRADLTVAFHRPKPCHRLNTSMCGKTQVVSIGIETMQQRIQN